MIQTNAVLHIIIQYFTLHFTHPRPLSTHPLARRDNHFSPGSDPTHNSCVDLHMCYNFLSVVRKLMLQAMALCSHLTATAYLGCRFGMIYRWQRGWVDVAAALVAVVRASWCYESTKFRCTSAEQRDEMHNELSSDMYHYLNIMVAWPIVATCFSSRIKLNSSWHSISDLQARVCICRRFLLSLVVFNTTGRCLREIHL